MENNNEKTITANEAEISQLKIRVQSLETQMRLMEKLLTEAKASPVPSASTEPESQVSHKPQKRVSVVKYAKPNTLGNFLKAVIFLIILLFIASKLATSVFYKLKDRFVESAPIQRESSVGSLDDIGDNPLKRDIMRSYGNSENSDNAKR